MQSSFPGQYLTSVQASLNLSGDQEHLPTDGTFAPYSIQSMGSQEHANGFSSKTQQLSKH